MGNARLNSHGAQWLRRWLLAMIPIQPSPAMAKCSGSMKAIATAAASKDDGIMRDNTRFLGIDLISIKGLRFT